MKIKYTGTPGENLESINMYGIDFPKGKFVDVVAPFAVRKLSKHPHFEAKDDPANAVEDAAIKNEFETVANAALRPVEDARVAAASTLANLTEEEMYGDQSQPVGDASPAEAGDSGSERTTVSRRSRKGG